MNEELYQEFKVLLQEFGQLGVFANHELVLVGSWALRVYKEHYPDLSDNFVTSDVDFSINRRKGSRHQYSPNLGELLQRMDYQAQPKGIESGKYVPGVISDNHLDVEFLMLEKTAKNRKGLGQEYYADSDLGIIFSPLPYQDVLTENAIYLDFKSTSVLVPKPEYWAIHKIARSQSRVDEDKAIKDLRGASEILKIFSKDELYDIGMTAHVSKKWKVHFENGWSEFLKKIENA
jgi:hypothetical protein